MDLQEFYFIKTQILFFFRVKRQSDKARSLCRTARIKITAENANALRRHRKIVFCQNKTPSSVLRRTKKGVLFGYCLGVRRNHVTRETVAAPLPMAKV
ncbi:hypothetical protein [Faecalibacterium wellingii]|uniref:hypothetical protein n=1 Tax=Faecalibacterium wellingii TaxID=2929491 RepID=UPI0030DB9ADD